MSISAVKKLWKRLNRRVEKHYRGAFLQTERGIVNVNYVKWEDSIMSMITFKLNRQIDDLSWNYEHKKLFKNSYESKT